MRHGAFTLSLLERLRSANNELTVNALSADLYRSVTKRVREKTNGRSKQTVNPIINGIVELKLSVGKASPRDNIVGGDRQLSKIPNPDLQTQMHEEKRAKFAALMDSPEIQSLMAPFFTKSLARATPSLAHFASEPNSYSTHTKGINKLPMSWKTIKRSNAPDTSGNERQKKLALRQLVVLARLDDDQRPDWDWPRHPGEADWNRVINAQTLLKTYGEEMKKQGYLSE